MPDMWMDVDAALSEVPVNIAALVDDTDFKTREESVVFDQSGLDLVWNFVTTAGAFTQTAVTPTESAGVYDWTSQGNGMYSIEIPASGGGTINNDTEGHGWFSGFATGILPWRGPIIGFRAAALNNALIDGGDNLDTNVVQWVGNAVTHGTGGPDVNINAVSDSTTAAIALEALTGALVLTSATIETVTSQTVFVIPDTADATDDDAYNGAIAVFIDGTDPNQKSIRLVKDYDAGTRSVTVSEAPDFTITTSDTITILSTGTAGEVWDQVLTGNTHNLNTSAGKRLRQLEQAFVHASGTIATVTDGRTIVLDGGAVATADFYIGDRLQITEGIGEGQSRVIVAYSSGKICLLDSPFTTNPTDASLYDVVAADVHVAVSDADLAEGLVATATSTTTITLDTGAVATTDYYKGNLIIFTHGTGKGQSREITAYTSGRVVTMSPALATAVSTDTIYHIQAGVSIPEIVSELLTTQMTEAYAANGVAPTLAEATFAMHQMLMQFGISGTAYTVRKLDDSTTAFVVTLDDAASPTDAKRV